MPTQIVFQRDTINAILSNLGVRDAWKLSNAEAKASLFNITSNLASTRVVAE